MIVDRGNFFLLLSALLIFSNKFAFLMFFCDGKEVKRFFANARARELYDCSGLSGLSHLESVAPFGAAQIRQLESDENYSIRKIAVRRGKAFEYLEEITLKLDNGPHRKSTIVLKMTFVEAFSLKMI